MDNYKKSRNKSASPQHKSPSKKHDPAESTSTKFTIKQKVASASNIRGPYAIKRSVDPKTVLIERRAGEGVSPLFSRPDIRVNPPETVKKREYTRSSSSDSSSNNDRRKYRSTTKSKANTPKRETPSKVPYFLDERREEERLQRIYGRSRRSRSISEDRRKRRYDGRHRSRSKSSPAYHRRRQSRSRNRSSSRERFRSYRRNECSRSRSRSKDREKNRERDRSRRLSRSDRRTTPIPTTQYIPIPVPMPDYPYMHTAWGAPLMPMPPRYPPFIVRPTLPPALSFVPRHYRPPRYASNHFQRGHFRRYN